MISWCPSFGRVLIPNGFCFPICSIFPNLAESKFNSDSSSFICGKAICFLIGVLSSPTVALSWRRWSPMVSRVWSMKAGDYFSLIPEYTRVCPSISRVCSRVRFIARVDCLCLLSGNLLFFRVSCHGEISAL